MSGGLLALLDDVAALAKVAAASLDDVGAQAMKAGAKAAGVVIDDAAVTPAYVTGMAAQRELSVVGRIALGSLRNKLLFLLPAALVLGRFAPWAITPILMLGGFYLCYEAAEKVAHALRPGAGHGAEKTGLSEDARIRGAIQTDLILSGEIMAITLSTVSDSTSWVQAGVLGIVGLVLTVVVYGAVALIVKADDMGLVLAGSGNGAVRAIGRGMVVGVPVVLRVLSVIGTAAMAWVGGGILLHGMEGLGWPDPAKAVHHLAVTSGPGEWFVTAGLSGMLGVVVGIAVMPVAAVVAKLRR